MKGDASGNRRCLHDSDPMSGYNLYAGTSLLAFSSTFS
jgi:hypothetical protein